MSVREKAIFAARDGLRGLTSKEEAALQLLATGSRRSQIAQSLFLSESTVGHLLTAAKDKLGARTLPHAVHIFTERIGVAERGS